MNSYLELLSSMTSTTIFKFWSQKFAVRFFPKVLKIGIVRMNCCMGDNVVTKCPNRDLLASNPYQNTSINKILGIHSIGQANFLEGFLHYHNL